MCADEVLMPINGPHPSPNDPLAPVRAACAACAQLASSRGGVIASNPAPIIAGIIAAHLGVAGAVVVDDEGGPEVAAVYAKSRAAMGNASVVTDESLAWLATERAELAEVIGSHASIVLSRMSMVTPDGDTSATWLIATAPDDADVMFLASAISMVVDHAHMTLRNIDLTAEVNASRSAALNALSAALEATDPYTFEHARDVATWAVQIGERLGLPDAELRDLELAAIFHDIGKIAIPTEILNKPGSLTADEFEVMKSHTIIGERIIVPLGLPSISPVVRHEHERWDGAGYPDGIAGNAIPLGSRIIFVCDAYHAITSDRPYRRAQSHAVAREILVENAGSQFDPAVVSVFLDILDEFHGENAGETFHVGGNFDTAERRDAA